MRMNKENMFQKGNFWHFWKESIDTDFEDILGFTTPWNMKWDRPLEIDCSGFPKCKISNIFFMRTQFLGKEVATYKRFQLNFNFLKNKLFLKQLIKKLDWMWIETFLRHNLWWQSLWPVKDFIEIQFKVPTATWKQEYLYTK